MPRDRGPPEPVDTLIRRRRALLDAADCFLAACVANCARAGLAPAEIAARIKAALTVHLRRRAERDP